MIEVNDAEKIIKSFMGHFGVTAKAVTADRDYPPINRVMMDGIALKYSSYQLGQRIFKLCGIIAAGDPPEALPSPELAFEIMTGAALPLGCDVVIPYEWLQVNDSVATIISPNILKPFDHIHLVASDCLSGDKLLPNGASFIGPHAGIAASCGVALENLINNPNILLISTGDELVDIGDMVKAHQLRRSNVYALQTSLMLHGYLNIERAHLKDDPKYIHEHYMSVRDKYEILIYSGGVSRGKFDYLPMLWNELGIEKYIHGVAQRPGKPLWFGKDHIHNTIIMGLPGNPVSSLVCLHRYFLCKSHLNVKSLVELKNSLALTKFTPVKLYSSEDATLQVTPIEMKNSGEFTALAESDGFVELSPMTSYIENFSILKFYPWRSMR
jgi:molybdopterin molybdotransferase